MSLFGREAGIDERANKFRGDFFSDNTCPNTQDIHIVMLDTLVGRVRVVANSGSNARNLICGDTDSDATTANQDSSIRTLAEDLFPYLASEVRIIDGTIGVRSAIDDFMSFGLHDQHHPLLQWKTAMITAKSESHDDFAR